ncbi:hypothetical protein F5Y12DRAFT_152646 [Xylaria sp. FL1777]|nr:hypothetical protein F5Y12DRAFT_152646 [Xylaria sp. FL1777]
MHVNLAFLFSFVLGYFGCYFLSSYAPQLLRVSASPGDISVIFKMSCVCLSPSGRSCTCLSRIRRLDLICVCNCAAMAATAYLLRYLVCSSCKQLRASVRRESGCHYTAKSGSLWPVGSWEPRGRGGGGAERSRVLGPSHRCDTVIVKIRGMSVVSIRPSAKCQVAFRRRHVSCQTSDSKPATKILYCDPLLALPLQHHLQVFFLQKDRRTTYRGRSEGLSPACGYLHCTGGFSIQKLHLFAKSTLIHGYTAAAALATPPSLTPKFGPDSGAEHGFWPTPSSA